ncbi:MAG TPA: HDOD domain-containing protein [Gammaproteobacteria bacterium]|nr:HDOD domain-containing protein [Gammaproteobacteria bacterium]
MRANLSEVVSSVEQMISFPEVYLRVNRLLDDPDSTANRLAETISQDPGLTAQLLRMANSPVYGLSREVDTVARAVSIIGLKRLRYLVLATTSLKVFEGIPNELFSMDDFWLHSLYCGLAAKQLAERIGDLPGDALFVAGQLHDIGQLLMYSRLPDLAREAVLHSIEEAEEPDLYLSEREIIGFDHAQLGARLASDWHWPAMLVATIGGHHEPEKVEEFQRETAVVHIANTLAVLAELDTEDCEETDAPRIHPVAWEITGLDQAILPEVLEGMRAQFGETRAMLNG